MILYGLVTDGFTLESLRGKRSAEGVAVIKGFIAAYLSGKRTEHTTYMHVLLFRG